MDSIIVKFLNNQSTPEENQILLEWIEESPRNKHYFLSIQKIYIAKKVNEKLDKQKVLESNSIFAEIVGEKSYKRLSQIRNRKRFFLKFTSAAAVFLLVMTIGFFNFYQTTFLHIGQSVKVAVMQPKSPTLILSDGTEVSLENLKSGIQDSGVDIKNDNSKGLSYSKVKEGTPIKYNTLKIPTATTFQLTLSDGTKIWLNSESELRYPVKFDAKERRVYLKGEAYFEVTKKVDKAPFIVESEKFTTKVLGTSFNISSYQDNSFQHVTLAEGSVSVGVSDKQIVLGIGEQMKYDQDDQSVEKQKVDTNEYTSWIGGQTWFHDTPLPELTSMIKRFYGIKLVLDDPSLNSLRFSGVLLKSYDPKEIIELIAESADLEWNVKDDSILLFKKR